VLANGYVLPFFHKNACSLEGYKFNVLENRALRRIFGPKKQEVIVLTYLLMELSPS
jgi:hypothetical protein